MEISKQDMRIRWAWLREDYRRVARAGVLLLAGLLLIVALFALVVSMAKQTIEAVLAEQRHPGSDTVALHLRIATRIPSAITLATS